MAELVRNIGNEKYSEFINNFDKMVDKYRDIATAMGYTGELRFNKEKGKMVIFVVIEK